MKRIRFLTVLAASAVMAGSAFAIDANAVLEKYAQLAIPETSTAKIKLELFSAAGKLEETRDVMQYGNHKGGLVNTVFDFKGPASNKYYKTRVWQSEKSNKDDDKYVFEPSVGTVRRVNTTDRGKSFLGMDVTYNDMTIRNYKDDENTMLDENATVNVAGKNYNVYKIKSVPIANKNVEYAYRIQYINKETYLPAKIEYYSKTDKLTKSLNVDHVTVMNGKYLFRDKQTIVNEKTGHKTVISIKPEDVTFDKPLSDKYFSQQWLQTGK